MSGAFVSGPLDSNTRANPTTAFYGGGGGIAGVTSLNGLVGTLAVTADTSIGVTSPGLGAIQVSTAGRPQVVGTLSCTSLATGAAVFTGAISAGSSISASSTISGPNIFSGDSITATGPITCASVSVGAPGAKTSIRYSSVNTAISDNSNHNVGVPVAYPALITVAVTGIVTAGGGPLGYVEVVYVSTPIAGGNWSVRQISSTANGININLVGDNTPAGPQITFYVNAGTAGTAYSMWKTERLGQA